MFAGDVGFDLYDYLTVNGKADHFISVRVASGRDFREDSVVCLTESLREYLSDLITSGISDGRADGSVVLSSYIGTLKKSENRETRLLSSSTLSLKESRYRYKLPVTEEPKPADWTGQTDWPGQGRQRCSQRWLGSSAYDGSGKYSSLKVEVSVCRLRT